MEGISLDGEILRLQIALEESTTLEEAVKISRRFHLLLLNRERRSVQEAWKREHEALEQARQNKIALEQVRFGFSPRSSR